MKYRFHRKKEKEDNKTKNQGDINSKQESLQTSNIEDNQSKNHTGKHNNENIDINFDKSSLSSDIYQSKYKAMKDNPKEVKEFKNNTKLRNTITGLNNTKMKYESGLIDIILKVEKDNVNHYLKGDLVDIYKDISEKNTFFKNNVFLPNIGNLEEKTGDMEKNPKIPYNCSEDISSKLNEYPKTEEIIQKFTEKSKTLGFV